MTVEAAARTQRKQALMQTTNLVCLALKGIPVHGSLLPRPVFHRLQYGDPKFAFPTLVQSTIFKNE